jgi:hypothetical protein
LDYNILIKFTLSSFHQPEEKALGALLRSTSRQVAPQKCSNNEGTIGVLLFSAGGSKPIYSFIYPTSATYLMGPPKFPL